MKQKRNITFIMGLSTVVGTVIGSGIFFKPTAVFSATQNSLLGLSTWVIGALLAIAGGFIISELGTMFPETGGIIVYLEKAFPPIVAYLAGWIQMILYFPGSIAAGSIAFAMQFVALFGLDASYTPWIALAIATFIFLMTCLGSVVSGHLQTFVTVVKFLPIVAIMLVAFFYTGDKGAGTFASTGQPLALKLGSGVLATLYAYDGWLNIGNLAGEIKDPKKNIPRIILLGISFVALVYVAMNLAYLSVATPYELASSSTPATLVANRLFPGMGSFVVIIGILISVFGNINGFIISGIRIPYTMAKGNRLPLSHKITKTNKHGLSNASILIMYGLTALMIFSGSYDTLTNLGVFGIWVFTTLTFVAFFILRRTHKDQDRPYKVPLYPILPLIAIFGGLFVVVSTFFVDTQVALVGSLAIVAGIPFYHFNAQKQKKTGPKA